MHASDKSSECSKSIPMNACIWQVLWLSEVRASLWTHASDKSSEWSTSIPMNGSSISPIQYMRCHHILLLHTDFYVQANLCAAPRFAHRIPHLCACTLGLHIVRLDLPHRLHTDLHLDLHIDLHIDLSMVHLWYILVGIGTFMVHLPNVLWIYHKCTNP